MRVLNAAFRKEEIENSLLLPENSVRSANMVIVNKNESYLDFTVRLNMRDYKLAAEKNQSMQNAYKYRKKKK